MTGGTAGLDPAVTPGGLAAATGLASPARRRHLATAPLDLRLAPYLRRVGLVVPHDGDRPVGTLLTRVVCEWQVTGPRSRPVRTAPRERVEWRVRLRAGVAPEDARDHFSDDAPGSCARTLAELDAQQVTLAGRAHAVRWLTGPPAAAAWEALGW